MLSRVYLVLFLFMLTLTGYVFAQYNSLDMEGLNVALEHYSNGVVKVRLIASKAKSDSTGHNIRGEDITYKVYSQDGNVDVVVWAQRCKFKRDDKLAYSDGKIKLVKDGIILTGKGFNLDFGKQFVTISSNVRIEIPRGTSLKGLENVKRK